MADTVFYAFQPDAMSRETLEKMFVGQFREQLLSKLVKDIERAIREGTPRHYLIVGPRGIGKTHFITLLYYRIADKVKGAIPVKLSEEEFSIYRVSDLLLRIVETLDPEKFNLNKIKEMTNDEIITVSLEELKNIKGVIVLFLENLNQVIDEQLDETEVKKLRSILHEETKFIIVATAPLIFPGVSEHKEPFFDFFEIVFLLELSRDELKALIRTVAEMKKDEEFLSKMSQIEYKIDAIATLTGGNPRIAILLYDLMSKGAIIDVEEAFFKLLDENTPYYQDIFRMLTGERRKIFDTLVSFARPATPKEISEKSRLDNNVVNSQMRRLEKDGYVISHKTGKTTKYEVRERLFRLWRELRREPFGRRHLSILIEFLLLWYSADERRERLLECLDHPNNTMMKEIGYWFISLPPAYKEDLLSTVIEKTYNLDKGEFLDGLLTDEKLRIDAIFTKLKLLVKDKKYNEVLPLLDELGAKLNFHEIWEFKGWLLRSLDRDEEAIEAFSRALKISPKNVRILVAKARSLSDLGKHDESIKEASKALELDPKNEENWLFLCYIQINSERYEGAIESASKVIETDPNNITAYVAKGIALSYLRKKEQASIAFSEALTKGTEMIKLHPNDPELLLDIGCSAWGLKQYDNALEAFSNAARIASPVDLEKIEDIITRISVASHLKKSFIEFEKKNYGDATENLRTVILNQSKSKKEIKEIIIEDIFGFLMDVTNLKNVEAFSLALKEVEGVSQELQELFKPFYVALGIIKTADTTKYYDVQIETREIVANIVQRVTGSTDLVPIEYKSS